MEGQPSMLLLDTPQDAAMAPDGSIWIISKNERRIRRIWQPVLADTISALTINLRSDEPTVPAGYLSSAVELEVKDQITQAASNIPIVVVDDPLDGLASTNAVQGPVYAAANSGLTSQALISSMQPGSYSLLAQAQDLQGQAISSAPLTMTVTRPASGVITTILNQSFVAVAAPENSRWAPTVFMEDIAALEVADDGTLYFSSEGSGSSLIWSLTTNGVLTQIAGTRTSGQDPHQSQALDADLGTVQVLKLDKLTNSLLILNENSLLQLDISTQIVERIMGLGTGGVDNGPAADWTLNNPWSLDLNADGSQLVLIDRQNLYLLDLSQNPITARSIYLGNTNVTTHCSGNPNLPYSDNGAGLAWGSDGLIYVMGEICTGSGSTRIDGLVAVNLQTNMITPVVNIANSVNGNLVFDSSGRLYWANQGGHTVISWHATEGFELIAGVGSPGSAGDLGLAISAQLDNPSAVAITPEGDIVIADKDNHAIRKVWR